MFHVSEVTLAILCYCCFDHLLSFIMNTRTHTLSLFVTVYRYILSRARPGQSRGDPEVVPVSVPAVPLPEAVAVCHAPGAL